MTLEATPPVDLDRVQALLANIEEVIYGKREAVTLAVVGLLARGHVLLEDVPGTGKTTLARSLALSVRAQFRRIQFTADMLPTDVLGFSAPTGEQAEFRFRPGPIFGNIVLADELNRTTPRTQSSLLECMNVGRVSVDGVTHELPDPFLVVATQNPLEFEGTYPLPESQLDRFLLRIRMGYPDRDTERQVLLSQVERHPIDGLQPVLELPEVRALIRRVREVRVEDSLLEYILEITAATRQTNRFLLGVSPRAALGLYRAAQALALTEGRDFCVPDDVKRLVVPVLAHRLIPSPLDGGGSVGSEDVLAELVESLPSPQ